MNLKLFGAVLAASMMVASEPAVAAPGTLVFSYADIDANTITFGSSRAELMNIAIGLNEEAYVGRQVSEVKFAIKPSPVYQKTITDETGAENTVSTPSLSNLNLWLSKGLNNENVDGVKTHIPDIGSWPLEMPVVTDYPDQDYVWITYEFPEPYTITEGGVYVGISLSVDQLDESTKKPILLFAPSKEGGLYVQSTRTYKNWADRSTSAGGVLPMFVTLRGDYPMNGAFPGEIPYGYFEIGQQYDFTTTVTNVGQTEIQNISYTVEADGNSYDGVYEFEEPIPAVFGAKKEAIFRTPVVMHDGSIEINVHITGVNGEVNEDEGRSSGFVSYVTLNPKHVALVEEYTGTWCGFCPRGIAAMRQMTERYEDFIGVTYHSRDPMTMIDGYPEMVSGYPQVWIERTGSMDPYGADTNIPGFSLPYVWERYNAEFTPIAITVSAAWNDEDRTVTANTELKWAAAPTDMAEQDYRLEYVLIADNLTGEGRLWEQHNYYHNNEPGSMEYMEDFLGTDEYLTNLVFDDVAIMTTGKKGISGSIDCFEYGVDFHHSYTFNTDNALNILNEQIPFHPDQLRVVAFVLKGIGYGQVLNAAKCDVVYDPAGIGSVTLDDKEAVSVEYYDIAGRKILRPSNGFFIETTTYSDGSSSSRKILF